MSHKLLIICGPTATGKTKLAGILAKKFNGEIVSADSRQVYKGMDIGTGKEWGDVPIYGYDLVDPTRDFSISQYLKFARKTITDIAKRDKLPILVGGTGFYIRGVVDGIPTAEIPRNKKLREQLEKKVPDELFENLSQLDAVRAGSMNSSDRKNPRRLIRAIEIAQWRLGHASSTPDSRFQIPDSVLMVGLMAPKEFLDSRISQRVDGRVKMGVKAEIEGLLRGGVDWNDQSMQALGYRQWRDHFEGGAPEDIVIAEWRREEVKYAKRQMTWFKKDKRVNWFDISRPRYQKKVEFMVKKWYSGGYAEKS